MKKDKDRQVDRYEVLTLPVETEREYPTSEPEQRAKIIPFPGVTLAAPDDDFQTQLDGFLCEIGYIE